MFSIKQNMENSCCYRFISEGGGETKNKKTGENAPNYPFEVLGGSKGKTTREAGF